MNVRGVIEGFYGTPWSHADRLDLIAFCGRHGLNTWVHAPKDDPLHRARWRDLYPDAELELVGELVQQAARSGVEFAYAIAPGLSICYTREEDLAALLTKCEQLRSAGVRSFQLLFDDIEHTFNCPEDDERYGDAERPSGAAQADLANRFREGFPQPGPLVVCPMGYAGTGDSPYRRTFSPRLHPDIVVYWTGPEVVSLGITREALNTAVARFGGHTLLIWDNYPVNDFDVDRVFLGPLLGRDPRLANGNCAGLVANGMVQAIPCKLALATVADWAGAPEEYDPVGSFERALAAYGAEVVTALRASGAQAPAVDRPSDVAGLVRALELGVDAGTAIALLEPFL